MRHSHEDGIQFFGKNAGCRFREHDERNKKNAATETVRRFCAIVNASDSYASASAAALRDSRLRSLESSQRLRSRTDFGVTSTSSSSAT
jgi:hypothetical protein